MLQVKKIIFNLNKVNVIVFSEYNIIGTHNWLG